MKAKLIKGLSQVQSKYDAFFIDLWGVIHNGIQLYPGAIEVLENLNKLNKRFVLISNAPRPSKSVKKFLLKLKMDKILLKDIFTSGEAALQSLQKQVYGKNFYHLGPQRDNSLFEGFKKNRKNLKDADFILCTGFLDSHEDSVDYYEDYVLLEAFRLIVGNFASRKEIFLLLLKNPELVKINAFRTNEWKENQNMKLSKITNDIN